MSEMSGDVSEEEGDVLSRLSRHIGPSTKPAMIKAAIPAGFFEEGATVVLVLSSGGSSIGRLEMGLGAVSVVSE